MRKQFIFVLVLFSLFITTIEGKSQTLKITNVTVIDTAGNVKISWEYDGSDTLGIYRDKLENTDFPNLIKIPSHSGNSYSFIDSTAKANERPRAYLIYNTTVRSNTVSTFHLAYSYESCQLNLKWIDHEFNQWTPLQFIIHIVENGNLDTIITVDASAQGYIIENLKGYTNYSFFIETVWQGQNETSNSNQINLFNEMPASPEFIRAISVSANGNNTNLKFEIDPNSELDTYKLLKANSPAGNFDTLDTFITTNSEITATVTDSKPESRISYYKLISVNECGNETTNSDTINNILLKVENDDFLNTLTWNSFKENSLAAIDYEIYRIVGNSDPELIGNFSNFNHFQNDIESLQNYTQFCYYIKAKEQGASEYSQSNIACIYLKPKVYIPEAFTPNDDGLNDLFQPVFAFVPTDFELIIYNRWGNKIFETGDYTKAWNGKELNGNPAPAGSYIYYVKIKSPNGQIVEKRGNITVIYP